MTTVNLTAVDGKSVSRGSFGLAQDRGAETRRKAAEHRYTDRSRHRCDASLGAMLATGGADRTLYVLAERGPGAPR
jgi:hypothetical protein